MVIHRGTRFAGSPGAEQPARSYKRDSSIARRLVREDADERKKSRLFAQNDGSSPRVDTTTNGKCGKFNGGCSMVVG
jgi:hypothetical protein